MMTLSSVSAEVRHISTATIGSSSKLSNTDIKVRHTYKLDSASRTRCISDTTDAAEENVFSYRPDYVILNYSALCRVPVAEHSGER